MICIALCTYCSQTSRLTQVLYTVTLTNITSVLNLWNPVSEATIHYSSIYTKHSPKQMYIYCQYHDHYSNNTETVGCVLIRQ